MKGEFRYKSKLFYMAIILLCISWIPILSLTNAGVIMAIILFVLSVIFFQMLDNALGKYEADETEVKFVTLGKKIVIEFKDIKKIELKNILKCEVGGLYYYNICLKIITSDNIYKYSSKFEPRFGGVKDLPLAFTERYNNNDFVLLYYYINERVSNKADEKPTE